MLKKILLNIILVWIQSFKHCKQKPVLENISLLGFEIAEFEVAWKMEMYLNTNMNCSVEAMLHRKRCPSPTHFLSHSQRRLLEHTLEFAFLISPQKTRIYKKHMQVSLYKYSSKKL